MFGEQEFPGQLDPSLGFDSKHKPFFQAISL